MNVNMLTRTLLVSIVFITVTSSESLGMSPVPIIGHVNNTQIEKFPYKKQCDSGCAGQCIMCEGNHYGVFVVVNYSVYNYRYLIDGKKDYDYEQVEQVIKQYQHNTSIVLYYYPNKPLEVSEDKYLQYWSIMMCFTALPIFIIVTLGGFLHCRIDPRLIFNSDKQNIQSIKSAELDQMDKLL